MTYIYRLKVIGEVSRKLVDALIEVVPSRDSHMAVYGIFPNGAPESNTNIATT